MPHCEEAVRLMTDTTPLVSVIMPVYNAGPYVRQAVDSILRQTYRHIELIIVDDGSTDGCLDSVPDLLADPRVRLVRQANRQKPAALNVGLRLAAGDFYAVQDADDVSAPQRIATQVSCLLTNKHLAGVYCGHALLIGSKGPVAPRMRLRGEAECARAISLGQMPALDPTAMFRVAMVGDTRYDEELPLLEGVDHALRVGERWPVMVLQQCLYYHRVHSASSTRRNPTKVLAARRLMSERLVQRRLGLGTVNIPDFNQAAKESANELMRHCLASVTDQVVAGHRLRALGTAVLCIGLAPGRGVHWRPLLRAFAPRALVTAWRSRRWRMRDDRRDAFPGARTG
jgi:glycosyltransferase involved in cell wall biosynthesis